MAEKERKQRLLDIYNKVDPKSTLTLSGKKFKKSDILLSDRKLMFEGVATLQQTRNRSLQVNVIVLSDILFFLHENNQKLYFISPEGKVSWSFFLCFLRKPAWFDILTCFIWKRDVSLIMRLYLSFKIILKKASLAEISKTEKHKYSGMPSKRPERN